MVLANTYHLHLRPGDGLIREAGGLHRFESWPGPILTDSGGFQVFSLRDISRITDEGVWFQSHIDGSRHFFSPKTVMEIEHNLGADVIMAFDECPPAKADPSHIAQAVDRTLMWARECLEAHEKLPFHFGRPQALFGIVQGSTIRELRTKCARELTAMDLPGYAIGGLAVGEAVDEMYDMVAYTAAMLPAHKPRYLMGVGRPDNILECIARGIDMFDCVLPTRNGRNGAFFTSEGKKNIRNACHTRDFDNSLDNECSCYACRCFSRGYLRHLYIAGEILGVRLLALHNVHFFISLVKDARRRIIEGTFGEWKKEMVNTMGLGASGPTVNKDSVEER
ncbi:MAG: tRNA guanosine(34) transglycosylase Tgt, partial [Chitinivibrionales bacterium]|nr:tRNA guanosine(34) transglycosylase Tgt [Chitinivibrionales bacterium]MBD3357506.1 tRNA guanosine(34) transglycosylase Tgt [Chitinivibrionales bacterium]